MCENRIIEKYVVAVVAVIIARSISAISQKPSINREASSPPVREATRDERRKVIFIKNNSANTGSAVMSSAYEVVIPMYRFI